VQIIERKVRLGFLHRHQQQKKAPVSFTLKKLFLILGQVARKITDFMGMVV
jgi:hypothetical protein